MGSRIADAALAAALEGDLEPAAAWLRLIGASVRLDADVLSWSGGPGVPVGGLPARVDPLSACILLLLATCGEAWALVPEGATVLSDVNRRWIGQRRPHGLSHEL